MTKKEFIKRYNVAYEDKEQQQDFAAEMLRDLNRVIKAETDRTLAKLKRLKKWCKMYFRNYDQAFEIMAASDKDIARRVAALEEKTTPSITWDNNTTLIK